MGDRRRDERAEISLLDLVKEKLTFDLPSPTREDRLAWLIEKGIKQTTTAGAFCFVVGLAYGFFEARKTANWALEESLMKKTSAASFRFWHNTVSKITIVKALQTTGKGIVLIGTFSALQYGAFYALDIPYLDAVIAGGITAALIQIRQGGIRPALFGSGIGLGFGAFAAASDVISLTYRAEEQFQRQQDELVDIPGVIRNLEELFGSDEDDILERAAQFEMNWIKRRPDTPDVSDIFKDLSQDHDDE